MTTLMGTGELSQFTGMRTFGLLRSFLWLVLCSQRADLHGQNDRGEPQLYKWDQILCAVLNRVELRLPITSATYVCSLILLCGVMGMTSAAISQTADVPIPNPVVKACSAPLRNAPMLSDQDGHQFLQKVVDALDPKGIYTGPKKFTISGILRDVDSIKSASTAVGTFSIQEDHTTHQGDYMRQFVVNGVTHTKTSSVGHVTSSVSDGSKLSSSLSRVQLKSYYFPLAVIEEELRNHKSKILLIKAPVEIFFSQSLAGLVHVEVIDEDQDNTNFRTEEWYFDPKTYMPVLVAHQIPVQKSESRCMLQYIHYDNYQNFSGVFAPTEVFANEGRTPRRIATVEHMNF